MGGAVEADGDLDGVVGVQLDRIDREPYPQIAATPKYHTTDTAHIHERDDLSRAEKSSGKSQCSAGLAAARGLEDVLARYPEFLELAIRERAQLNGGSAPLLHLCEAIEQCGKEHGRSPFRVTGELATAVLNLIEQRGCPRSLFVQSGL